MTCDTVGVISPIVQVVASYQVTHILQLLTGHKLEPIIQSFDIWKNENAKINVAGLKNKKCPTCGDHATLPYLSLENQTKTDILCGRDAIQIRPASSRSIQLESLSQKLTEVVTNLIVNPYLLSCSLEDYRIVLFKDGRAIIHGTNEPPRARAIYTRIIQYLQE
jgi:adenylyltransferase/sulfurtransferase